MMRIYRVVETQSGRFPTEGFCKHGNEILDSLILGKFFHINSGEILPHFFQLSAFQDEKLTV